MRFQEFHFLSVCCIVLCPLCPCVINYFVCYYYCILLSTSRLLPPRFLRVIAVFIWHSCNIISAEEWFAQERMPFRQIPPPLPPGSSRPRAHFERAGRQLLRREASVSPRVTGGPQLRVWQEFCRSNQSQNPEFPKKKRRHTKKERGGPVNVGGETRRRRRRAFYK